MKNTAILFLCIFSISSYATEYDVAQLLKRDLKQQINIISKSEIRYCPDNTCTIYHSKKDSNFLPTYVYLHIIHQSTYTPIYRNPFIKKAKEKESILQTVSRYCNKDKITEDCVIHGLGNHLGIYSCSARYDEGHFCVVCSGKTVCEKL
ncbi:MAG: hypothetical protein GY928_29065 [Colwellia sp.]|nr:hypothetical protein [Colwellia sp.]